MLLDSGREVGREAELQENRVTLLLLVVQPRPRDGTACWRGGMTRLLLVVLKLRPRGGTARAARGTLGAGGAALPKLQSLGRETELLERQVDGSIARILGPLFWLTARKSDRNS